MNRAFQRILALAFPLFLCGQVAQAQQAQQTQQTQQAQQPHRPRVEDTKSRAAGAPRMRAVPLLLFGSIPVSTRSLEARKYTELALNRYESVLLDDAIVQARRATEVDHDFALGYAVLSFISRRSANNPAALARAKELLPRATPDEQLLVRWMTNIQDRNLLPAIANMNDLLKRYPNNKHVLYLTSEWLYFQEDFDRSVKTMESLLQTDPNFPPVLNMLGYAYIEAGQPNPAKAVQTLKHYAEVDSASPNPEDSLGEVSRYIGEDRSSLEHYSAALKIDPKFFTSQLGLGDTRTLMGQYEEARKEYDRALDIAESKRDIQHIKFQRALVYFWEGRAEEGRSALAQLAKEAEEKHEPYAQFEVGLASAMLSADYTTELEQLRALEQKFSSHVDGMTGADRSDSLAALLCEQARVASQHGQKEIAHQAISQLAQFAAQSGDLLVGNNYETARGYLLLAEGDVTSAVDGLASNRRSPLATQQVALAQQKSGDTAAATQTLTQLKYQRAPTVEWFLASHSREFAANQAASN